MSNQHGSTHALLAQGPNTDLPVLVSSGRVVWCSVVWCAVVGCGTVW